MKIEYFSDTDTLYLVFSQREPFETKEINENVYIDVDESGELVAMTIEHAKESADIANLITASLEGHIAFQPLNVAVVIWPKGQPETIFLSTCSQAPEAAKAFHKAKELMDQHGGPKLIVADADTTELLKKAGRL